MELVLDLRKAKGRGRRRKMEQSLLMKADWKIYFFSYTAIEKIWQAWVQCWTLALDLQNAN